MRLFQNLGIPDSYRSRLGVLRQGVSSFEDRLSVLLNDRFGASHLLKPVLERSPDAFFTSGNDQALQRAFASRPDYQAALAQRERPAAGKRDGVNRARGKFTIHR